MKVHLGEKPKYIRFEGNNIFVSFDSAYWIYCGTLYSIGLMNMKGFGNNYENYCR